MVQAASKQDLLHLRKQGARESRRTAIQKYLARLGCHWAFKLQISPRRTSRQSTTYNLADIWDKRSLSMSDDSESSLDQRDSQQLVPDHTFHETGVEASASVPPTPSYRTTTTTTDHAPSSNRTIRSADDAVSDSTLTAAAADDDEGGPNRRISVPSTPLSLNTRSTQRSRSSNRHINFEEETDNTTHNSKNTKAKTMDKSKEDMDIPTTPMSERTDGNSLSGYASFLGDWGNNNKKKNNSNKNNNIKSTKQYSPHHSPSSSSSSSSSSSATQKDVPPPQKRGLQSTVNDDTYSRTRDNTHAQPEQEDQTLYPEGLMLVRGTDIHVETAARAFQDFLQHFISLQDCEKKKKKRGRMEEEDDSSDASDLLDDELSLYTPPYYMEKLKVILLGGNSTQAQDFDHNDDDDGLRSSLAMATTAFIDLNTQHLFHHSPACQKLYYQLVSSPTEVVPLMDILVAQELEKLLKTLHEEKANSIHTLELYPTLQPLLSPIPRTQVRPFYLKDLSYMRSLDPNAIDNLLTIRGMIVRSSPIIPDLKVAHFECSLCARVDTVTLSNGRIQEPTLCANCNVKESFRLIHNRCIFADKQMVRMQETPDEVPAGETPASIVLFAFDDLVDAVRPGDRVEVTGILRAQPRRVHPKISKVKSVYKTYLDVIHFRRISGTKDRGVSSSFSTVGETLGDLSKADGKDSDDDTTLIPATPSRKKKEEGVDGSRGKGITIEHIGATLSKERVALLKQMASDPDIYERLVQSLAPSIWGMDDVKKGVLCMLLGGNSKRVKKGTAQRLAKRSKTADRSEHTSLEDESDDVTADASAQDEDAHQTKLYKRGDINILLCGDPGTSKSQLLSYVHALSPRGVYTSGKGSSAVGLTASIVRDPETRELVLESGALVLSDLGCCCIDEFDKMSDTTRAILHEAMEQQTVSIAKAGIIATLNSRTSILASANPVESRYNPQLSVVENIKLPPTLLSRFDLIYLILDAPNIENDRRLAQHLVGLYYDNPNVVQPPLDQNLLRDFISYARESIHPELSDLATRDLISAYLDMRSLGGSSGTISATPRQLESLIRLSEALAKMRYSTIVSRADVKEAVRLMRVATQAAATDPRTGRIDMDMITTGRTAINRELEEALNSNLKEIFTTKRGNRMAVSDVRRELMDMMNVTTINQEEITDALRRVEADGLIQFNERNQTIFVRAGMI